MTRMLNIQDCIKYMKFICIISFFVPERSEIPVTVFEHRAMHEYVIHAGTNNKDPSERVDTSILQSHSYYSNY